MKNFSRTFALASSVCLAHAASAWAQPPAAADATDPRPSPIAYPSMPPYVVPSATPSAAVSVIAVPKPQPAPELPKPLPHEKVRMSDKPEKGKAERATPRVEVWRAGASVPQAVAGKDKHRPKPGKLAPALVGDAPVTVVLHFDRSLGGKTLGVTASRGVVIDPPDGLVRLAATAEATLQVALEPEQGGGRITFEIDNVRTVLPLIKVPPAMVTATESASTEEVAQ